LPVRLLAVAGPVPGSAAVGTALPPFFFPFHFCFLSPPPLPPRGGAEDPAPAAIFCARASHSSRVR
jgi:hypothetical protein